MEYIFPSVEAVPGASASLAGIVLCGVPAYLDLFRADERSWSAEPCWVREDIPDVESFEATFRRTPRSAARAIRVGVRISPVRGVVSTPLVSSWLSSCEEILATPRLSLTWDRSMRACAVAAAAICSCLFNSEVRSPMFGRRVVIPGGGVV